MHETDLSLKTKPRGVATSSNELLCPQEEKTPTEAIRHISCWLEWSLPALWQRLGQGSQQQIRDKGWQCITVRTDIGNRNSLCHRMTNLSSFCHTQISQPPEWLKWNCSPYSWHRSLYEWVILLMNCKCIPSLQKPVLLWVKDWGSSVKFTSLSSNGAPPTLCTLEENFSRLVSL